MVRPKKSWAECVRLVPPIPPKMARKKSENVSEPEVPNRSPRLPLQSTWIPRGPPADHRDQSN